MYVLPAWRLNQHALHRTLTPVILAKPFLPGDLRPTSTPKRLRRVRLVGAAWMLRSISTPFAPRCNQEFTGMEIRRPHLVSTLSFRSLALLAGLALLVLWSYWP